MLKAYKVEIKPNNEQIQIINQTIGTCRWVYNKFIEVNQIRYKNNQKHMSGYDFSKWLNNDFIPNNPDKSWIKNRSEEHTSELQSRFDLVCRLLLEKKKNKKRE